MHGSGIAIDGFAPDKVALFADAVRFEVTGAVPTLDVVDPGLAPGTVDVEVPAEQAALRVATLKSIAKKSHFRIGLP